MSIIISAHGNFCARIEQFPFALNPREEWEHMGKIAYVSSHYTLGDERLSAGAIKALTCRRDIVYLPVYVLIHSGTCLSTTPFSCPWDSWQSGIIYVEKEALRKAYEVKRLTQKHIREAQKILESEVEEFSAYLSGDVWEYQLFRVPDDADPEDATCEAWEPIDSLCGLYGYDYAEKEAISALASLEASLAAQPTQLTLPGLPTNPRGHVLPYGGSHAAA